MEQNFRNIKLKFVLDGKDVTSQLGSVDFTSNSTPCRMFVTDLSKWPVGSHHLTTTATFTTKINDGMSDYAAGDYIADFTVNVK